MRRLWLDLPIRGKGLAVVGMPIVMLLAGVVLLQIILRQQDQAERWVDHTLEVRRCLASIVADLLEAESAARAFVISPQANFMTAVSSAKTRAERHLGNLSHLVADNPAQSREISPVRQLMAQKFAAIDELMSEARTNPIARSPELTRSYEAMTILRRTLADMDLEESHLLKLRIAALDSSRDHIAIIGAGTLLLGFLGGLSAALLFGRSIARRIEILRLNARALSSEAPLMRAPEARDEIGQAERELELASELLAERAEKLRQSDAQFRAIVNNTRASVFVKDLQSRYLFANPRCAEIMGRSPEELIGRAPEEVYPPERAKEIRANDEQVFSQRRAMEFEEEATIGGKTCTFLSVKVPLFDKDGEPYALCGVSTEITGHKRAAVELRASRDELERRVVERTVRLDAINRALLAETQQRRETAKELTRTQAQLLHAQKMEVIGTVASGVAHDFNNVLTAIMGYATLILKENGSRCLDRATEILQSAERASALSRQLLSFSRTQPYEPRAISVRRAVERSQSMLRRLIGDSIVLETSIADDVHAVMADPAQFEQLLMNLVVNARDAMPGGGVIRINAQLHSPNAAEPMHVPHSAGWVGISVCDEGCGISPEMLGRIFEPFFTTKAPGQGTGLGLATCAMILERSGGWIDCQSQLGKGTTFTFYLPCAEEALEIQTARPEIPCATNQQTILVVEDEPTVGEVVAMLLGNLGYNVISAENGEIAERIVAERGSEIDLVLTDLNMPRMNGRELVQRLREINPRVQVILTSGNNPAHDQPSAQPLEFDFLPKPFRQQDLALKVHQVLER